MNHATMPGIPTAYIEASYAGHRATPGTYSVTLSAGDQSWTTQATLLESPLFGVSTAQYAEFDALMTEMEQKVTLMHEMTNRLFQYQGQLVTALEALAAGDLKNEGQAVLSLLQSWDEDMVQRMSKAYDDVENFENKFTAEYLFLINQTNSAIPRVNQSSLDRKAELDAQWETLKARGELLEKETLPELNQKLWEAGIGALRLKTE